MAYIGRRPDEVFRAQATHDTFTGDGSTVAFDLSFEAPDNDADLQVFVDNVRQEPGSSKSYTIGADGSGDIKRITFVTAPASSAEIYVINPGRDTSLIDVADAAVTTAKLGSDAVTGAKLADDAVDSEHLTDGSVDNVHLAGSIANSKLANSSITINGTAVSLGGSVTAGTDWQAVVVADGSTQLTAEAGKGYFLDTNTGVIEVFLPASPSRGDTIFLADYGGNFATNNVLVNTQGQLVDSVTTAGAGIDYKLTTNNLVVELVYVDNSKGWQIIENEAKSSLSTADDTNAQYIEATGGTILTSGNFKTHVFTGDGNFVVAGVGNDSGGGSNVEYLVVAGGGAGGTSEGGSAGGGGAGGFRSFISCSPNPLNAPAGLPVSVGTIPVTVGAGGTSESHLGPIRQGNDSVFSTITSAKGGAGRPGQGTVCSVPCFGPVPKMNGGSGGGGSGNAPSSPGAVGGTGNTPPVSPAQGTNGGNGFTTAGNRAGGGGGGAAAAGQNGANPNNAGDGGAGSFTPTAFWGPTSGCYGEPGPEGRYFAGGGGAQRQDQPEGSVGDGGLGGGGNGGNPAGVAGTANTGSGGGAGFHACIGSGTGGKGIVAIRYQFQKG